MIYWRMPAWTFHDPRRSCATRMGRIGIAHHIIETALNHASGFRSGVAGVNAAPLRRGFYLRFGGAFCSGGNFVDCSLPKK